MDTRLRSQLKAGSILENNDPRKLEEYTSSVGNYRRKPRVTVTGIYTAHDAGQQFACYMNAKGRRCQINIKRIVEAGTKTTHGWTLVPA